MMRQTDGHTAESEQMQRRDQGEGINVQGWAKQGLRPMIGWWGHWCHFVDACRYHKLISTTREQASWWRSAYLILFYSESPSMAASFDRLKLALRRVQLLVDPKS